MLYLNHANVRFRLRVVVPARAVLVGAVAIVLISLREMADAVDQTEHKGTDAPPTRPSAHHPTDVRGPPRLRGWDDAARKSTARSTRVHQGELCRRRGTGVLRRPIWSTRGARALRRRQRRAGRVCVADTYGPSNGPDGGLARTTSPIRPAAASRHQMGPRTVAAVGRCTPFTRESEAPSDAARLLILRKAFDGDRARLRKTSRPTTGSPMPGKKARTPAGSRTRREASSASSPCRRPAGNEAMPRSAPPSASCWRCSA